MTRKDLLLDTAGNLVIEEGDFVVESSDMQHVKHIVESQKGEFKEFPFIGFGVENYLKTNTNPLAFKRDLKIQLEYDDYKHADIDLSKGYEQLKINL